MDRRQTAKNTAIIAVMAAILISAKFALYSVANVEIVTPLIIVFTCVFRFKRVIFSVLIFCLLDNFLYYFSLLVTIQYFFHWPLLCLFSELTYKIFKARFLPFTFLAVFFALLFWVETSAIYFIFNFQPFLPSLILGYPFMIPMAISAFFTVFFGFIPLYKILIKIEQKMFYY